MKQLILLLLLVGGFIIYQRPDLLGRAGVPGQPAYWETNYAAAMTRAKAENKRVLLDFTGSDWCGWCTRMQSDTLTQTEFKEYAAKNLVLVELDFPRRTMQSSALKDQNNRLKSQYGVRGFPHFVLTDSSGRVLGRQDGYLSGGPRAFVAKLESFR